MPDGLSKPSPAPQPRGVTTVVAAGLLLAALALIVLYTSRSAFLSPIALVVVAAIGIAAVLLQVRLQPMDAPGTTKSLAKASLWLTGLGAGFAAGAVVGDFVSLGPTFRLVSALAAVGCFAVSAIMLLDSLRRGRR